jgi:hypothetical protein
MENEGARRRSKLRAIPDRPTAFERTVVRLCHALWGGRWRVVDEPAARKKAA